MKKSFKLLINGVVYATSKSKSKLQNIKKGLSNYQIEIR